MTRTRDKNPIVLDEIMERYREKFSHKRNALRQLEKQFALLLERVSDQPLTILLYSYNHNDGVGGL